MSKELRIWEKPKAKEIYLLAGWRQWVDGGAISSGLPRYLWEQFDAHKIGEIIPDGFYLFQLPGTQDMLRPMVRHEDGHPKSLQARRNEFYYAEVGDKGLVFFVGDEPHMDVERYTAAFMDAIKTMKIKRTIIFGGIYGEVPYDKERFVTSIFSMEHMRAEVDDLSVNLSSYQGGASIGSVITKRAGDQDIEVVGFYTFSPIFHFAGMQRISDTIHIEKDYMAWLGVMRRVVHMLKLDIDLSDLEERTEGMIENVDGKLKELDKNNPDIGVAEYVNRLSEDFDETSFSPLEDVWQEELRRLGDRLEPDDGGEMGEG